MKNSFSRQSIYFILFCTVLALTSCTKLTYRKALVDAAQPSSSDQYCELTKIFDQNPNLKWKIFNNERYVLVASWKNDAKYYKNDPKTGFYNTGKYPIWVTAAPDLQNRIASENRKYKRLKQLNKRLKQLLGLPPNDDKKLFVEFWVRPQDLARPCMNTSVTDSCCEFYAPDTPGSNCENLAWLLDQTRASFADSSLYKRYPFTGLGYTYDWKRQNKKHIGLSEFVIGENKNIVVEAVVETMDYFKE